MSQQFPTQYSGNLPPYPPNQPQQPYSQYPQQPIQEQPPFQQYPQQPPPGYYQPQGPYMPQQQPQKKKRTGVWIALAIGLVVVIGFCAIVGMAASGASKTATTTTGTGVQATTDTSSSSSSAPSGNILVSIGKPIVVDDVSCTATSAKILLAGQYDQPKRGQEYIVVHVKMVNNGQSDQNYNPFDFHAKSSAGNVTNYTYTSSYTANNALDAGTMAPGGKAEGDLVFQVPVGDSKAELTWTPSFFNTSTQYAWKLNIK